MVQTSFPKDKIRVLLLEKIHPEADAVFAQERFSVARVDRALTGDELVRAASGERVDGLREVSGSHAGGSGASGGGPVHIVGIRSASQLRGADLARLPRLLAVGCFCIGTNQVDLRSANLAGVPVFNSPFCNTRSVAELTVAEVIALQRGLLTKSSQMHRGQWDKSASGSHEVRGRTLGIVGYGRIGSQVSILAEALGMRVVYFDVAPVLPLGNARACRTLEELLSQSDVVSLHVPATKATQNLVSSRLIGLMKPGALLINNARGSVVDLGALSEALKSGKVGGAALDVFPDEPSSNDEVFRSPVCGLDNVILTPHIAGSTVEAQQAIAADVSGKLVRYINNGSTTGAVNVPQVELPEQWAEGPEGETHDGAGTRIRRHRILNFHKNVPGVLSKMNSVISAMGANIAAEYLQTNAEVGYVVLDVDPTDAEPIMAQLKQIPETIRVRMLW